MPRFLSWLVLPLMAWIIPGSSWGLAQEPNNSPPSLVPFTENIPASLADLLRDYEALGLPLPFNGARFIYLDHRNVFTLEEPIIKSESFCFEAKSLPGEKKLKILQGLETKDLDGLYVVFRGRPDKKTLEGMLSSQKNEPEQGLKWNTGNRHELILAIQCYAEGHHEVAQFFLDRCRIHTQIPLRQRLLTIGWDHLMNEFANPKTDRAQLLDRLKKKVAKIKEWDTPEAKALIADLEMTLKPFPKRQSQAEEWIDQLTNYKRDNRDPGYLGPFYYLDFQYQKNKGHGWDRPESNERLLYKMLEMGLEAAPVLLNHLEDRRLTWNLNLNFSPDDQKKITKDPVVRIGTICQILLEQLAKHPNGPQEGVEKNLAFFLSWWSEVCKEGEEAYLVKHCFYKNQNGKSGLYDPYLHFLNRKYPHQIPGIYKKNLLGKPEGYPDLIAQMIARGALPEVEKIRLLNMGIENSVPSHRFVALAGMRSMGSVHFARAWTRVSETFLVKEYKWDNPETAQEFLEFGAFLFSSRDPILWSILVKIAKVAPPQTRGMFLSLFKENVELSSPRRAMLFLLEFLDDQSGWEIPRNPKHPMFVSIQRMEIRNVAARSLAEIMMLPPPQESWTQEDWADYREKVRVIAMRKLGKK